MNVSLSSTQKLEDVLTPREKDIYLQHVSHNDKSSIEPTSKIGGIPVDEVETIEKIAEMVSNVRRDSPERILNLTECCPMTKKQRQVLLSQRLENDMVSGRNANKQVENMEAINLSKSATAPIGNTNEKCKFEEVEIKLEEMFAGIEDEQATVLSKDSENQNSLVTQNSLVSNTNTCEISPINDKVIPTKAAIKAADPVPFTIESRILNEAVDCTIAKNLPPRRRLSMAIQSPLLLDKRKSSVANEKCVIEKEASVTSNINNTSVRANKDPANHINVVGKKNKSFANKRKTFSENKRGRMQITKQKKKPIAKVEEATSSKMKALKLKNRRSQNSSSSGSENDQDERVQQTIDAKYRSPYILVKNDGSISVVNTTTTDESTDKNNKSKRTSSYVPERRNVRGIYSSTLSNKYDADTADTTWICVFCKRGPHKKGLGDLFGPYIINFDNEEYKTITDVKSKHLTASSSKRKRTDGPQSNTSSPIGVARKCDVEENVMVNSHEAFNNIDSNKSDKSPQHFLTGMSRMTSNSYEVWFHEDCAVWAPNLYIVGSRLVGLDNSIWQSTIHTCVCCQKSGAIICCLQRDCKETAHLPCARESKWSLDESKFWAYCAKHHGSKIDPTLKNQGMRNRIELSC